MSPLYPVSSSVYYAPNVAKQLQQERAAEEQRIRDQYTAQLAAAEKDARAKFEADLKAKREAA